MKKLKYIFLFILTSFALHSNYAATDTIKVMDWNILNFAGTDTSRVQYYRTVIGSVSPDIFVCQEINGLAANRVLFKQVFEAFAPGVYDTVSFVDGPDSDNLLFFKKSKASFISNTPHHTELRDISEFKMYFPFIADTVRFFSCHLKASTGTTNEDQRGREADTLRYYTDQLPAGKYFILMGDFNFYKATEPAYINLLAVGGIDGKFNDPITGMTGNWNSVAAYAPYYTQSPRVRSFGGGAAGGMDDRFDLMLHSNACMNNANKFYYVPNSHIAYGNDGNHLNDSINKMPNTAVSSQVADGIHYGSDHIPIMSRFVLNNQIAPVELSSFVSFVNTNNVKLKWSTVSELNNSGFEIERKSSADWQKIAFINGSGTSNIPNTYTFLDKALQSGNYQYRLKQVDFNGNFEYFNLSSEINIGTPDKFAFAQNYPNPFNPSTSISFNIPAENFVSLVIYDLSGKEVMNVIQEKKPAGYYSVNINASALPSGTYFYRLSAGDFTAVRKMVLLK